MDHTVTPGRLLALFVRVKEESATEQSVHRSQGSVSAGLWRSLRTNSRLCVAGLTASDGVLLV